MRDLILLLSLLSSFKYAEDYNTYAIERKIHTYVIRLQTSDKRWITDSVSAETENDARNIIHSRYPGCVIYSVSKIN